MTIRNQLVHERDYNAIPNRAAFAKEFDDIEKELKVMLKSKEKAEIQALSSFGFQFLTETYLPLKLQRKDWI